MTIDEARQVIKAHFNGDISNVRKFLEALNVAEESDGEMTIDQLEKWGNGEVKKYKCNLMLSAEDDTTGTMMLTKEEYEIVKRVTCPTNWDHLVLNSWCGSFSISCDKLDKEAMKKERKR